MTKEQLKQTRVQLYKATPLKLVLVDELIYSIKHCFGDKVEINGFDFKDTFLKLGKLQVRKVEIDPQEIGAVLIHWYPNHTISTQDDPYCSAYMLSINELRKLIKTLQSVSNYYKLHNKM